MPTKSKTEGRFDHSTATHFALDGIRQANQRRIDELEQMKLDADDEITRLRQFDAEITAVVRKVCGMPRVDLVLWTPDDDRMAAKFAHDSRADSEQAAA